MTYNVYRDAANLRSRPGAAGAVVRLVCTLVLRELAAVVAR
jgi:hypothetical protein